MMLWAKSKKQSHKPKSEDTIQEKLYLLRMDLYGPMRVASESTSSSLWMITPQIHIGKVSATKKERSSNFHNKAMASEQLSSGPGLQFLTPATSSSGLVPNSMPQKPCNAPPRDYWDRLFQPMFDEYFNPLTINVSPVPVAAAPRAVNLADSLCDDVN
ncbi:hypothetical protein Tco_0291955 [Tanacetum coccineum]